MRMTIPVYVIGTTLHISEMRRKGLFPKKNGRTYKYQYIETIRGLFMYVDIAKLPSDGVFFLVVPGKQDDVNETCDYMSHILEALKKETRQIIVINIEQTISNQSLPNVTFSTLGSIKEDLNKAAKGQKTINIQDVTNLPLFEDLYKHKYIDLTDTDFTRFKGLDQDVFNALEASSVCSSRPDLYFRVRRHISNLCHMSEATLVLGLSMMKPSYCKEKECPLTETDVVGVFLYAYQIQDNDHVNVFLHTICSNRNTTFPKNMGYVDIHTLLINSIFKHTQDVTKCTIFANTDGTEKNAEWFFGNGYAASYDGKAEMILHDIGRPANLASMSPTSHDSLENEHDDFPDDRESKQAKKKQASASHEIFEFQNLLSNTNHRNNTAIGLHISQIKFSKHITLFEKFPTLGSLFKSISKNMRKCKNGTCSNYISDSEQENGAKTKGPSPGFCKNHGGNCRFELEMPANYNYIQLKSYYPYAIAAMSLKGNIYITSYSHKAENIPRHHVNRIKVGRNAVKKVSTTMEISIFVRKMMMRQIYILCDVQNPDNLDDGWKPVNMISSIQLGFPVRLHVLENIAGFVDFSYEPDQYPFASMEYEGKKFSVSSSGHVKFFNLFDTDNEQREFAKTIAEKCKIAKR